MESMLLEKALELPAAQRVEFAEIILASIDYEDASVRNAWLKEVRERMESVKQGRTGMLDYDTVLG